VRLRQVIARTTIASLFVTLVSVACLPGLAQAAQATITSIYQAFTPHGFVKLRTRSKAGYCWEGALTIARRDAWRCLVGNYVYDPCFSAVRNPGIVVCPDAPWRNTGVKIRLTKPLPRAYGNHSAPSLRLMSWAIELKDGRRCLFASGVSDVAEGKRLNYICGTGSEELWGFPYRGSEPWTILTAPPQATELRKRATVRHAWM